MTGGFKYMKGQYILISRQARDPPQIAKITFRSREKGENIYDYEDFHGNFLWCRENDIIGTAVMEKT